MRVSTNNNIARYYKTFFWKKTMFNTHLTYFKIVCNIFAMSKFSNELAVFSRLNILVWCKVVRYNSYLILIKNLINTNLIKFLNSNWSCYVITKYKVKICFNKLTCLNRLKTCMSC